MLLLFQVLSCYDIRFGVSLINVVVVSGAFLFMISDLVLGLDIFHPSVNVNHSYCVMIPYYLGQIGELYIYIYIYMYIYIYIYVVS